MKHPVDRGARRRARQTIVDHRSKTIHWARCSHCTPGPCRCTDRQKLRRRGSLDKTPKPCSCWMCGNPRRHLGEATMAERKVGFETRRGLGHNLGPLSAEPFEWDA